MSDASQATASASTRKQVSKRDFVGGEDMESAKGGSYQLLGEGGKTFTYNHGENANADRMFAIFGFHTKVGNVANTVLNDKDNPGSPADAGEAIAEFLSAVADGTWAERSGGVGVKIDKDALAGAYVDYCAANGQAKDYATVRQALEDKPVLVRQLRAVPEIAKLYQAKVGKPVKSVDEVTALI